MSEICTIAFDFGGQTQAIRMHACGGRDQVVHQALRAGWRSYEAPMPLVLSRLIASRPTAFLDIGANTGFYSLLAARAGAAVVRAYEPVPAIADLVQVNCEQTFGADASAVQLYRLALSDRCGEATLFLPDQGHGLVETSASLNPEFRAVHSGSLTVRLSTLDQHLADEPLPEDLALLIKLDVESLEPQVLQGAAQTIEQRRPAIVVEILPGSDLDFYGRWLQTHRYRHYHLLPPNQIVPADAISPSLQHRDHLLLPEEFALPF